MQANQQNTARHLVAAMSGELNRQVLERVESADARWLGNTLRGIARVPGFLAAAAIASDRNPAAIAAAIAAAAQATAPHVRRTSPAERRAWRDWLRPGARHEARAWTDAEVAVAWRLVELGREGRARIARLELAARTGYAVKTVDRALAALQRRGLVTWLSGRAEGVASLYAVADALAAMFKRPAAAARVVPPVGGCDIDGREQAGGTPPDPRIRSRSRPWRAAPARWWPGKGWRQPA